MTGPATTGSRVPDATPGEIAAVRGWLADAGTVTVRTTLASIAAGTGLTVAQVCGALDAMTVAGDLATLGAPHPERLTLALLTTPALPENGGPAAEYLRMRS